MTLLILWIQTNPSTQKFPKAYTSRKYKKTNWFVYKPNYNIPLINVNLIAINNANYEYLFRLHSKTQVHRATEWIIRYYCLWKFDSTAKYEERIFFGSRFQLILDINKRGMNKICAKILPIEQWLISLTSFKFDVIIYGLALIAVITLITLSTIITLIGLLWRFFLALKTHLSKIFLQPHKRVIFLCKKVLRKLW